MSEPIQFIGYVGPNNTPAAMPGAPGMMGFPGAIGDTFQLPPPPPDPARHPVPYLERWQPPEGSPESQYDDDGSAVIRDCYVPWEGYISAVKDHLGYPIMARANGGRYISRLNPRYFPHWTSSDNGFGPIKPFLYCTQILKVVGVDCPTDLVTKDQWNVSRYEVARLTTKYETLTYDIREDSELIAAGAVDILGNPDESDLLRNVTIEHAAGATYLTLPQGSFVWAGYGEAVPGTPGKIQPNFDVKITWHRIPRAAVPLSGLNPYIASTVGGQPYVPAIENCLGCVNKFDFAGFKKGTLLLTGVGIRIIRSAVGDRLFDLEFRFSRFPVLSRDTQADDNGNLIRAAGHNLIYWVDPTGGGASGYFEIVSGVANVLFGSTAAGSAIVTNLASTAGLRQGTAVSGAGIPAGTIIVTVDSPTQVTINQNAIATAAGVVLDFAPGSVYRRSNPPDGYTLFDYRSFADLFRVPQLKMDPGNT